MKYFTKPDGSRWAFELDGSQDHLITPDMLPCAAPVVTPVELSKEAKIAAILAPYDVSRREVQAIIAVAELNAKVEFLVNEVPIETTLAESFTRNPSYRIARQLEDACKAVV